MDLRFRPEEEAWRTEVRDFLDRELPPRYEFETDFEEDEDRWAFCRAFSKKVAQKGWLTLSWPKEHGGSERPLVYETIFRDEFAYRGAPLFNSAAIATHTLLKFASNEQKRRYLPNVATNDVLWAEGLTEPDAGSDLASLQTKVELDGDNWVINGQKTLVTWAHRCHILYLAGRTNSSGGKHDGISIFAMPLDAEGVTIQPLINIGGGRQNHIFMDDVRIPRDALIGEVDRGWHYITNALHGGAPMGTEWAKYKRAFDDLVAWCKETHANGQPMSRDPLIREGLTGLAMDFEVLKLIEYEEIWRMEAGLDPLYGGAIGQLFMKEFIPKFADVTQEIVGPMGIFLEGGEAQILRGRLAALYLQSYGNHAGGTSQTKRVIVARRGLGLPR